MGRAKIPIAWFTPSPASKAAETCPSRSLRWSPNSGQLLRPPLDWTGDKLSDAPSHAATASSPGRQLDRSLQKANPQQKALFQTENVREAGLVHELMYLGEGFSELLFDGAFSRP